MADTVQKHATYKELEAVPPHLVGEIIGGSIVTHPRPAPRHAAASAALTVKLAGPFQDDPNGPGGWIFLDEPELHLSDNVVVPDLAGWRRERISTPPDAAWLDVSPDWVCEILSGSTETRDRTVKMRIYGAAGIPHMWLIDPRLQILEAFELRDDGLWALIGAWNSDEQVRARPFDAILFALAGLWPFDKPLGLSENPQALYAGDR